MAMAARKGIITFGLVSIPVELHVAARPVTIAFHQVHAVCGSRINYRVHCPTCEREVERKELVRGHPWDGGFVVMDEDDFEKAAKASSRAIDVVQFVDQAVVDPVYLETSYYIAPQPDMGRAYSVFLKALQNTKKAALVTFVMSNRQHYALLRAHADRLLLHTLYYADEVRPLETASTLTKPGEQEVNFAEQYIEALSKDFDPEQYKDEYRETLGAIIRAKAEGQEIQVPEAAPAPPETADLMEALRRSVEQARKPPARVEPQATRPAAAITRLDERKRASVRRPRGAG
jgi:DNA end-binding protein Ku